MTLSCCDFVFVMNDDLLDSFIYREHPHYIHNFTYVMNDDFLNSFIHSEHPYYICTIFSIYSLFPKRLILYQCT
jgi:hypothetical protein